MCFFQCHLHFTHFQPFLHISICYSVFIYVILAMMYLADAILCAISHHHTLTTPGRF